MTHEYGEFSDKQMHEVKESIRKQIFFLLLIVDEKTRDEYNNVDVNAAFDGLLRKIGGLNKLLGEPIEIVEVLSILEAAWSEYNDPNFQFRSYRRLILSAGSEVLKIKEV